MLGYAGCALAELILYDIQGLKRNLGAGETAEQLRVYAALAEDPGFGSL